MLSLKYFNTLLVVGTLLWQHWAAGTGADHLRNLLHRRDEHRPSGLVGPTGMECTSPSCYRYYNNQTKPYFIEHLPEVNWDIGEIYSGSVQINASDPSRTLFFVFKPAMSGPVDEITIYLNGGPGASSLLAFSQENGPILWQPGTTWPRRNPYTWANITNMMWVEYPIGTGFSQGKEEYASAAGATKDFLGFFKNFQDLFGIKNYKIYVTGESVAGIFVPYISAAMLEQNDTTYFDLSGALVYDGCIGDCTFSQTTAPSAAFATANQNILNIPQSKLSEIQDLALKVGWTQFLDKYLTFPPPGNQPISYTNYTKEELYLQDLLNYPSVVNPCFNIAHIVDYCPMLTDLIATPPDPAKKYNAPYFNRLDVKKAMHAPLNVTWNWFTFLPLYVNGQTISPDPIQLPLPKVIEATNRVVIGNGDWDGALLTNGTLLAIQNMTWNGQLGFQSAPSQNVYVPTNNRLVYEGYRGRHQGIMGRQHYERGLMFVETYQAGHEVPQYQPRATLLHLEWLLGRIDSIPSSLEDS